MLEKDDTQLAGTLSRKVSVSMSAHGAGRARTAAQSASVIIWTDERRKKGAGMTPHYPGGDHTWRKALADRPLALTPDEATVRDLQASVGGGSPTPGQNSAPSRNILEAIPSFAPRGYPPMWLLLMWRPLLMLTLLYQRRR